MMDDFAVEQKPLLSEEEHSVSVASIRSVRANPELASIRRFANGLKLFNNDVTLEKEQYPQDTNGQNKIYAIDAVEVASHFLPSERSRSQFRFDPLFQELEGKTHNDVQRLEYLVSQQLLMSGNVGVLLLDPYVSEVRKFSESLSSNISKTTASFPHEDISPDQLSLIEGHLNGGGSIDDSKEFLSLFREIFLPKWRHHLVEELIEKESRLSSINNYLSKGKYAVVRGGDLLSRLDIQPTRSIEHLVRSYPGCGHFNFSKLAAFLTDENVKRQFSAIQLGLMKVLKEVDEGHLAGIERDARAIAQTHTLNRFFSSRGFPIEVDFISRSSRILDLLASLPRHRLRVAVRHPMFIPEIYDFSTRSMKNIRDIFTEVASTTKVIENLSMASEPSAQKRPDLITIRRHAQSLVQYLSDVVVTEQSAEQSNDMLERTAQKVVGVSSDTEDSQRALSIIRILKESLDRGSDPITRSTWAEVVDTINRDIVRRGLTRHQDKLTDARAARVVGANSFAPAEFYAVRFVAPYLGTVVQFYSEEAKNLLQLHVVNSRGVGGERTEAPIPIKFEIGSIIEATTEMLQRAATRAGNDLTFFSESEKQALTHIESGLEASLLAAIIFASHQEYEAAIRVLVVILRPATLAIRMHSGQIRGKPEQIKLFLCLRELFLLRSHCERALAIGRFKTPLEVGEVEETLYIPMNFGRAQRDLDLAVLMAEYAEGCLPKQSSRSNPDVARREPSPAGVVAVRDHRHLLAHIGGWLDQFIIIASVRFAHWPSPSRIGEEASSQEYQERRLAMWTMAGFAKELDIAAFSVNERQTGEPVPNHGEIRYLYYIEAQLLERALTLFVTGMAFNIVQETHLFLKGNSRISSDRSLVFRDWPRWWQRYQDICENHKFEFRMKSLLDPVFARILELQDGKTSGDSVKLAKTLQAIANNNEDRHAMAIIAQALADRLKKEPQQRQSSPSRGR